MLSIYRMRMRMTMAATIRHLKSLNLITEIDEIDKIVNSDVSIVLKERLKDPVLH